MSLQIACRPTINTSDDVSDVNEVNFFIQIEFRSTVVSEYRDIFYTTILARRRFGTQSFKLSTEYVGSL